MTGQVQGIVAENRENVRQTMASVRDLTASLTDVVSKDRLKVERLLDGLDVMRARAERVLYQADQIAGQVAEHPGPRPAEIERSVTNVRDATDWANKLVQKIYANPFVLSPFYKPNARRPSGCRAAYDTALVFTPRGPGTAGMRSRRSRPSSGRASDTAAAAGNPASSSSGS